MGTQTAALLSILGCEVTVWDRQMSEDRVTACTRDPGVYAVSLLDTAIARGTYGWKNGTSFVEVLRG